MPKEITLEGKGTLKIGDASTLLGYPISFTDNLNPTAPPKASYIDDELYAIFSAAIDSGDSKKVKDAFRENVFSPYPDAERPAITHKADTSEELFTIARDCVTPAPGTTFVLRNLCSMVRLSPRSPEPMMPDRY